MNIYQIKIINDYGGCQKWHVSAESIEVAALAAMQIAGKLGMPGSRGGRIRSIKPLGEITPSEQITTKK